jgi:hypothetical protein
MYLVYHEAFIDEHSFLRLLQLTNRVCVPVNRWHDFQVKSCGINECIRVNVDPGLW